MPRKLILGVITAALSLGVFSAPAGAVETADVAVLNGIPTKIDICVGRRAEIASGIRFGRAIFWQDIEPGTYRLIIRQAAAGRCRGSKLGVIDPTWLPGEDHTSVIWKPSSTLQVKTFTNDRDVPAGMATVAFRHVARQPRLADVWLWEHVRVAEEFPPTFDDVRRGHGTDPLAIRAGQFYTDVFAWRRTKRFDWEGFWGRNEPGQFRVLYLIGTAKKNYKIVSIYGTGNEIPPPA